MPQTSALFARPASLLLLLVSGAGWGLTMSLATIATTSGRHPISIAFWSTLFGLALISLRLAVRGKWPSLARRNIVFYAVTGFLGAAAPQILAYYAASELPANVRAVVNSLVPMMTLAIALALSLELASLRRFIGLGLGVVATIVLLQPASGAATTDQAYWDKAFWIGVCVIIVACYAAENVYVGLRRPPDLDLMATLWGMTLFAALMQGGAAVVTGVGFGAFESLGRAEAAMALIALAHLCAYASLIALIARAGAVFASQVSYFVAPSGAFWGAVLLAETLTLQLLLSIALAVAGLALVRPRAALQSR